MKKIYTITTLMTALFLTACGQTKNGEQAGENNEQVAEDNNEFEIMKSNEEWKKELDPEVYYITREKGTERAYTGKYYKFDKDGIYRCSNCGNPLFKSEHKFESGSGWPSFYTVYDENSIREVKDSSHGMVRTEVVCRKCGAHLGHVFEDGPNPTGLRYCINSPALQFEDKAEKKEEK